MAVPIPTFVKRIVNFTLARRPRFVVIGAPRSGTTYFSALCKANGAIFSHEAYYTPHGPVLRNPRRRFDAIGDVSWLAIPYLPDRDVFAVHQVRDPIKVIRSIYEMGLLDPRRAADRQAFADFVKRHFELTGDTLRDALRFYIDWNERCEAITPHRFRIEDLDQERGRIGEWLGIALPNTATVSRTTNRRAPEITQGWDEARLRGFPEFDSLRAMASRYDYDVG